MAILTHPKNCADKNPRLSSPKNLSFLNKMYLFSSFFDELLTTVDQNVQSVASYVVNNIIGNITFQAFYIFWKEKKKQLQINVVMS